MVKSSELPLAKRSGLPAEIAYLRAAYPAAEWRRHAAFGQLSAFWLQIHDSLRAQAAELQAVTRAFQPGTDDPATFQHAFVPRLNHFLQHLNAHHHIEDSAYFPKFRALDPRMVRGFDLLEADHGLIEETLRASVDGARGLLAALAQPDRDGRQRALEAYAGPSDTLLVLLRRHLADEEELVIPAMLEHGERAVG